MRTVRRRRSSSQRLMKSMENRDVRAAVFVVLLLPVMTVVALYLVLSREETVLQTTAAHRGLTEHVFPLALTKSEEEEGLCILNTDVVFIHTPACGSEVVQSVLFRFGYQKDLFVTLPVIPGSPSIGSGEIHREDFLQPSVNFSRPNQVNILAHRARYNKDAMRAMFPETTQYITILRHPLQRFETDFFESKMHRYLRQGSSSRAGSLKDYLDDPNYWESQKTTSHCTRNCMSAVLGFPLDGTMNMKDTQAAMDVIKQLDSDFALVLIYEYLDQSLVLLKRYMCWGVTDIMHYVGSTLLPRKETLARLSTEDHIRNFRRVNTMDYLVYDYFNKTLWRKIEAEGPEFHKEVKNFQNVQKEVAKYCRAAVGNWTSANHTVIAASDWNKKFDFTRGMCYQFGRDRREWESLLKERYFSSKRRRPRGSKLPIINV